MPTLWRVSGVSVLMCLMHVFVCFPSWQRLSGGVIHGTHPIRHSACATHVFLVSLLVFSSSAITTTLPAIFFPTRDKRITDVRSWERSLAATSPPHPHLPPALRLVCDNLCTLPSPSSLVCASEAGPSLVRYAGTRRCTLVPPTPTGSFR